MVPSGAKLNAGFLAGCSSVVVLAAVVAGSLVGGALKRSDPNLNAGAAELAVDSLVGLNENDEAPNVMGAADEVSLVVEVEEPNLIADVSGALKVSPFVNCGNVGNAGVDLAAPGLSV